MTRREELRAKMEGMVAERIALGWTLVSANQAQGNSCYIIFDRPAFVHTEKRGVFVESEIPANATNIKAFYRGKRAVRWSFDVEVNEPMQWEIRIADHDCGSQLAAGRIDEAIFI